MSTSRPIEKKGKAFFCIQFKGLFSKKSKTESETDEKNVPEEIEMDALPKKLS